MNEKRLHEILESIREVRIAVLGDFFLDRYWKIASERDETSLETGLTAYQIREHWSSPGAAGTVLNNLAAIGVARIHALGFLGKDAEGFELVAHLERLGVDRAFLIETPQRATPTYTKPIRDGVEMNRFDRKNRTATSRELEDKLIDSVAALAGSVDAIILMDQVSEENCGVLSERVRKAVIQRARENPKPLFYADSRERIGLYENMIIKCNEREARGVFGHHEDASLSLETLRGFGSRLCEHTGHAVFITLGHRGQLVIVPNGSRNEAVHVPAVRVEGEIDICGAGDASSSAIVASLCAGASWREAALLGNLASSITIRKIGRTGTASPEEIHDAWKEYVRQNPDEITL